MNCPHCGSFVAEEDVRCAECGTPIPGKKPKRKFPFTGNDSEVCSDGLVSSIVVTILSALCCFSPFGLGTGITAIVLSAVAKQALSGKDQARGIRLARYARIFRIITLVLIGLQVLLFFIGPSIAEPLGRLFEALLPQAPAHPFPVM